MENEEFLNQEIEEIENFAFRKELEAKCSGELNDQISFISGE